MIQTLKEKNTQQKFYEENPSYLAGKTAKEFSKKLLEDSNLKIVFDSSKGLTISDSGKEAFDVTDLIKEDSTVGELSKAILEKAKENCLTKSEQTKTDKQEFDFSTKVEFYIYDLDFDNATEEDIQTFIKEKLFANSPVLIDITKIIRNAELHALQVECEILFEGTGENFYKKVFKPYRKNLIDNFNTIVNGVEFDEWLFNGITRPGLTAWRRAYNKHTK